MSYDPNKPHWSIMTKTHGGEVSVIRDLTLDQARQVYERMDPWYGSSCETFTRHKDYQINGVQTFGTYGSGNPVSAGNIEIREVFGPPGWEGFDHLDVWPKTYMIYVDDKGNILPDGYQEHPERAARHRRRVEQL